MINLAMPIAKLSSVGARMVPRLKRLGIRTVRDLLRHFPSRYEDYSRIMPIKDVQEVGVTVAVQGVIAEISSTISWKSRRLVITNAIITDDSGSLRAVWFNQPYLERSLVPGTPVSLAGKVSLDKRGLYLSNPSYEKNPDQDADLRHTGRLVPIYPETSGLTSKYLRFLIKPILDDLGGLPDPLPSDLRERLELMDVNQAVQAIHFPTTLADAERAKRRFAFEDILLFQLQALRDRQHLKSLPASVIAFDKELIARFVKQLPFELTQDQRLALYEILKDLERPYPMNRLLNGDVGSGKTVVALAAAYEVAKDRDRHQAIFMAPTEILARQHFQTITSLIRDDADVSVGLFTRTQSLQWPVDEITEAKVSKKLMLEKIKRGDVQIVIGTHALIQDKVIFKNPALVVIDEQHRFGVEQRMQLVKGGVKQTKAPVPHLLSMTATPIPRTLALTIYGDLDVSILQEKPKGRQVIITRVIEDSQRQQAYRFIDQQIKAGRQVFVICPRIEIASEAEAKPSISKILWAEVKAVTQEYERLATEIFSQHRVAMLHGRLKSQEKQDIMERFKNHEIDILVSTSVVEVGVDIANASLMMIESAERFGLAQLHQFRGRVGRGEHQSYCFLFTSAGIAAGPRLRALEKMDNGLQLAEIDMKLRGPGEFTGVKQSGMPDLAMAALNDLDLIKTARLEAKLLLESDPALMAHPLLKARLLEMQRIVHFE